MDAREILEGNISVQISDKEEAIISLKKGTWSSQEDSLLINYISLHGEGRWNYVARDSGLNRTGKSCRLRWKNYLQPNVRRGNFTAEEQLCIAELHCLYGNRWSKIAEFLPGRTDNEIKNYWRTCVHKQAKQLKYDTNSAELREFVRNIWLPRLSHQIQISQCNNNNLENTTMNYDVVGSEALQMDHWVNALSCEAVEAHQVMATDNLFMNSDCGFYSPIISELDLGQYYDDMHSPYIGCSDSPACFSYGELSNIHQLNDDWHNFGHAHEIIRNN